MSQWFISQNEKVKGPLSADEVKAQVAGGLLSGECLIWGRSLDTWQSLAAWMRDVPHTSSLTQQAAAVATQMWHYAVDGDSKGPLSRVELVTELKNLRNSNEILVWTKGMKAWADLYEFHDLLDEAGINRREHPRASVSGSVVIKIENQTLIGQLKTISPGGFGASQLSAQLSIGQAITVEIKSDSFPMPLTLKATVQYTSDSGFFGFKFQNVNMESKAHIMEYIKNAKPTGLPAQAA